MWCGGSCTNCGTVFSCVDARHHCRHCGIVVCSSCQASDKYVVPGSKNPKIVCVPCSSEIRRLRRKSRYSRKKHKSAVNSTSIHIYQAPVIRPTVTETAPIEVEMVPQKRQTRQSLAPVLFCISCEEPLNGAFVLLDDASGGYCSDCFVCYVDGRPLCGTFLEHDGNIYCEEHYSELFCEVCGGCSQRISSGLVVKAFGSSWHQECFFCARCTTPLVSETGEQSKFQLHNGLLYCEKDYNEHCAGKCAGCGFEVRGGLTALNVPWHYECFSCVDCRVPIAQTGAYHVIDGQQYCVEDGRRAADSQEHLPLRRVPPQPTRSTQEVSVNDIGSCISLGIAEAFKALQGLEGTESQSPFKDRQQWRLQLREIAFDFEAFAPVAFGSLRNFAFGIRDTEYFNAMTQLVTEDGAGGGKPIRFDSFDRRFLVKFVEENEMPFFYKCLQDYHSYLLDPEMPRDRTQCCASLLPKFVGVYALKFDGRPSSRLVVAVNPLPPDCQTYYINGALVASENAASKDAGFVERGPWRLGLQKEPLLQVLRDDVRFLQQRERLGYSLAVGIVFGPSHPLEGSEWPTVQCGGVQSILPNGMAEVFFFGIVDMAPEDPDRQALRRRLKSAVHDAFHRTHDAASMPALQYGERFIDFLEHRMR